MAQDVDPGSLPVLITADEYARLARVKRRTIWQRKHRGVGPRPVSQGGRCLYRRDEVLAFLGLVPASDQPAAGGA